MARLDNLQQKVKDLYEQKLESRADWADWLYPNHVLVVAENARNIAAQVGADVELSEVAALLHDIADYKMERNNPKHETESLELARTIMTDCGYTPEEVKLVVDDAIRFHSCHGNERPQSQEGLVLATADSLAHLETDFYVYAAWKVGGEGQSLEDCKQWTLTKIERDLHNKISFDFVREQALPSYEAIKLLFSR